MGEKDFCKTYKSLSTEILKIFDLLNFVSHEQSCICKTPLFRRHVDYSLNQSVLILFLLF